MTSLDKKKPVDPVPDINKTNEIVTRPQHELEKENWIILCMVTLCNILFGIFWIAFPILYIEFSSHFETSQGVAGWIGSIQNGLQQFLGIVTSSPIALYGCRINVMIGSIIVSIGIALSAFANSVFFLYLTYGVLTGIGMSFVNLSCQVAIQQNFNKNRSMATAIAMMGKSAGQIIGPILIQFLIDVYGWRGALLVFSAIFLNGFAFALGMGAPTHLKSNKKGLKGVVKMIFDCSMMRDVMFSLFCISFVLFKYNNMAFYRQLPSRLVHEGMDRHNAALILSMTGIAQLIGRLISGMIGNFKHVNRVLFYCLSVFSTGIITILLVLSVSFWYTSVFASLNGAATGTVTLMANIVIVDLFGVENIARSKGLFNVFNAAAGFLATPTTGWMFDLTGNYDIPYLVAGSTSLAGGCLACVVHVMHQRRLKGTKDLGTEIEQITCNTEEGN